MFGLLGGILLSVIFGVIALGRTKRGGLRGRGMAIGGLVLSGVWAVIISVAIAFAALSPTHSVSARDIKVGDCFAELPTGNRISSVETVSCDRPHVAEVAGVLTIPDGPFPGDSGFDAYTSKCKDSLSSYSPTALLDPDIDLAVMPPRRSHGSAATAPWCASRRLPPSERGRSRAEPRRWPLSKRPVVTHPSIHAPPDDPRHHHPFDRP